MAFDVLKKAIEGWEWLFELGGRAIDSLAWDFAAPGAGLAASPAGGRIHDKLSPTVNTTGSSQGSVQQNTFSGDIMLNYHPPAGQESDPTSVAREFKKMLDADVELEKSRKGEL